jgi:phosphatidylglycerol:prolipoprotein diacylglycerol transferase
MENFLFFAHWVHNLDPVIFQITETIALRWYGLAYIAGFASAYGLLVLYSKKGRIVLEADAREFLFMAVIIGVLVGGRLGYVLLYDTGRLLTDPLSFFRVWEGGMASHGGFIGVAIALAVFCARYQYSFWKIADIAVVITPPGLFFGRIANFINGELWGKISDVPWAVVFPQSEPRGYPLEMIAARHPSQLYAALLEGLILFVFIQWRFWRSAAVYNPGKTGGEFLMAYGVLRIIGEIFREPDASLILGMSRGTFYSLLLMAAGIGVIIYLRWKAANAKV